MAIPTIVVYTYSSNENVLRLLDSGQPVNLLGVDMIELRLGTGKIISSADYPDDIEWYRGYDPTDLGRVFLRLGRIGYFATKDYVADLFVYDPHHYKGIFWGKLRIRGFAGGAGDYAY